MSDRGTHTGLSVPRINIALLRKDVETGSFEWVSLSPSQQNAVLALLDAVEAAHAVREHDDNDPRPLRPTLEKMYERLEVFDFGGAA